MNQELLDMISRVTPEEEQILAGNHSIEKERYMSSPGNQVDAGKLLESGKLISVRTHTRFVHFPRHTHNYIEVIYMCSGTTHHVINGKDLILNQGELLFLSQSATQEIYPAGLEDVAVNFIVLPEFFDYGLKMISAEKNQLRDFVADSLTGGNAGYLHFKVSQVLPVQNLVENLIWTIVTRQPNRRSIQQATMGLLFLQLMNHMDLLDTDEKDGQQRLVIEVLSYLEEHYREGSLKELADRMHYDFCWLSREIKKQTGKTYTELLQQKRLNQAAYLLQNTGLSVMEIALAVGYDNVSYFHRIFQKEYGMTPRKYRVQQTESSGSLPDSVKNTKIICK